MLHFIILGLFVILAVGFVSVSTVARRSHERFSPLVAGLVAPLLRYNLWELTALAFLYVETAPDLPLHPLAVRMVGGTLQVAHAVLGWLWLVALAGFAASAVQAPPTAGVHRVLRRASLGVMACGLAAWLELVATDRMVLALPLLRFSSLAIVPLAWGTSLFLLLAARQTPDTGVRRSLCALGGSYAAAFGASLAWMLWVRLVSPAHKRFVLVYVGFDLLYNLLSVLWVVRYGDRLAAPPAPGAAPDGAGPLADAALAGYGITKREREVVALICQGKTNQEIADALFISVRTVKEHNYNVFQKTGVRNRVELARLVSLQRSSPTR